jgi:uncharacterized membrane protein YfcA
VPSFGVVAALSAIVLAAAVVQRAVGFGFALFAVPLTTFVLPTKSAVVVVFLIGSITSAWVAVRLWSWVDWRSTRRLGAGVVVGAPVGVVVLAVTSAGTLRLLVGFATCAAAVWILVSSRLPSTEAASTETIGPGRTSTFAIGMASGIINTSLATGGPPLVYELRRTGFSDDRFRATLSAVFVVSNVIGLPLLATSGLITGIDVALAASTLLACVVGIAIGAWVGTRMEPAHFVWSVDLLLLATGALTIVKALS